MPLPKYYRVRIKNEHYSAIVIIEEDDTLQDVLNLVTIKARAENVPDPKDSDIVSEKLQQVSDPLLIGVTSFEKRTRGTTMDRPKR